MAEFPLLDPDLAYLHGSLFLPKSKVAAGPVERALTFGIDPNEPPRVLVREHRDHLEVPRNYKSVSELEQLGLQVVDLRPKEFEEIDLAPIDGFEFRSHQKPAWAAMWPALDRRDDFILRLDTGRGKTVMGWRAAAELRVPTLVVSAQKAHLSNWEKELKELFVLNGTVGWIADDRMEWEADIVLATVQTLVKRFEDGKLPREFTSRIGLTIFDEAHHQAAAWFSKASEIVLGVRLGLTATLKRRDRCEGVVTAHIGPVVYDDPSEDVLIPTVHLHRTPTAISEHDPEILDKLGQPNVSRLRTVLGQDEDRNQAITDVAVMRLRQGRKVYILSHSKDQVYLLAECLRSAGHEPGVITGDVKEADERLRQLNNYDVVVATVHVGKENYNREELSALLLASPMGIDNHAPTEFVQSTGRILRPVKGKPDPVVDLFVDEDVLPSLRMLQAMVRWCYRNQWPVRGDRWTRIGQQQRRLKRSRLHRT